MGFGGNPVNISLSADPSNVVADGSSSLTLTAVLTDGTGAPVMPGTAVTFTTGLGSFPNGEKSYTVQTPDATGIVSASLIAGVVPGTTFVMATANFVSQSITVVFSNNNKSRLALTATPATIPANGTSTSLVTATLTTTAGAPIKGVPITFYNTETSNTPTPLPDNNTWRGSGNNLHVTPDFYSYSGTTTFIMTSSGSAISNFSVRLYNRDTGQLDSTLINVSGPVTDRQVTKILGAGNYYFQVSADGTWEINVDGSIGPAQVGDPVVLAVANTNAYGQANYIYQSTTSAGVIGIKAETGESTYTGSTEALSQTVLITQTGNSSANKVEISASPNQIYANGEKQTTVSATVTDEFGNPVLDGTVVTFLTTAGVIEPSAQTVNGVASVQLTSVKSASTLTATVTGTAGTLTDSTQVTFMWDFPVRHGSRPKHDYRKRDG